MKKLFFSFLTVALIMSAKAQQDAEYNMYMFNGLYLNPAYAGSHEVVSLTALYRHQWAGMDGAPRTANISVHSPFKRDQYALGLTIANDRLGLTNMFSATIPFAYRLRFNGEHRLAFGIQASFTYYQQRNTEAVLENQSLFDQSFSTNKNMFIPNFGAGVYAYGKRYYVGFSVPHLLPSSLAKQFELTKNSVGIAKQYNHYLLTAGYVFGKDASIVKVKPSFLMKYQQGLERNIPDFDFNLGLLFIDRIWVAASVRTGGEKYNSLSTKTKPFNVEGIIGMVEGKITPQLRVGYAYHYAITDLRSYQSGTHEIMLGYDFWYDKKRFVTPRYVKYF